MNINSNNLTFAVSQFWRGGRAAEGARLESV